MQRIPTICLLLYWALLFTGTHLPQAAMPGLGGGDKFYHFAAYSGLAFLIAWALDSARLPGPPWKFVYLTLLVGASYSLFDELTQELVPGRTFEFADISADLLGTALGLITYCGLRHALMLTDMGKQLLSSCARSR